MNEVKFAGNTKEFEKLKTEIDRKYKNLNTERLRFLDQHIFPSMANLVKFFEYLAKYPELRQVFEEDMKELFGYITEPEKKTFTKEQETKDEEGNIKKIDIPYFTVYCQENGYNNIMRRFLESVLTWDLMKDPNNFRLGLIKDIQYNIFQVTASLAMRDFSGDFGVEHIINNDIGRAVSWSALFGSRYRNSDQAKQDKSKLPKRPILF